MHRWPAEAQARVLEAERGKAPLDAAFGSALEARAPAAPAETPDVPPPRIDGLDMERLRAWFASGRKIRCLAQAVINTVTGPSLPDGPTDSELRAMQQAAEDALATVPQLPPVVQRAIECDTATVPLDSAPALTAAADELRQAVAEYLAMSPVTTHEPPPLLPSSGAPS